VLVIGFAETATAIGAAVAVDMNTNYIQTTREIIDGVDYLFFSEEHSHATEQKLVKNDIESIIYDIDRIIFVEDEVTTGNTILNIIMILEKLYPDTDFKAFMCISWLLSPDLKALLKPTSNIISFQNRFYKFPVLCSGLDVFNFVFLNVVSDISEVDLNALPQNSSLEKGLKNLYQSGDFIHEAGGVFPF